MITLKKKKKKGMGRPKKHEKTNFEIQAEKKRWGKPWPGWTHTA